MRVLIDECLPKRLLSELAGHDVSTVAQQGWSGKKNGELLALMAAAGFEVFLTADQNLQYQQNLKDAKVAILVLSAASTRYQDVLRCMASVRKRLAEGVMPGQIYKIAAS